MTSRTSQWRKINKGIIKLASQTNIESIEDITADDDNVNQNFGLFEGPNDSVTDSHESSDENDNDEEVRVSDNGAEDIFQPMLAKWVVRNQIFNIATNELLKLMQSIGHNYLPNDVRTLLNTPRSVEVKVKCGGEYIYFGLQKCILKILNKLSNINKIDLVVNIDGFPLYKSSSVEIWPILCQFSISLPFSVAIFCGNAKPSSESEFLEDFLEELTSLSFNGVEHAGKHYPVSLKYFCCDAPARQFLKSITSHTGYNACERCEIPGEYLNHRVIFEGLHFPLRTDIGFNLFNYKEHQKSICSLSSRNVPCISGFVLDIMHLVYLGVVKRILKYLYQGPKVSRLAPAQKAAISDYLLQLNGKMPSEFARQPRSLAEFKRWKATEFKNFLLYTGMVVLKNIVSRQMYHHFLSLSVAVTIMVDDMFFLDGELVSYAQQLLNWFVSAAPVLYGQDFMSYNVHHLTHIADDISNHSSSLQEMSAFPFENYLRTLKKYIRKPQNPLSQITKRIAEIENTNSYQNEKNIKTKFKSNNKDSWFFLYSPKIICITKVLKKNDIECNVYKLSRLDGFFSKPCCSKLVDIYLLHANSGFQRKVIKKNKIRKKACAIPYKTGTVIIPLHHNVKL
ncbi:uncharacterized protein LOC136073496 [Hydra vulgaris]|uniref:uncharacterized protein LOC136073496 n=1 Tax=Hydra vulgaris TaxID=6087 RepID=UPI0032EA5D89